jgi:hypothetical protein
MIVFLVEVLMHQVFHLLGHNPRVVPGDLLSKGQQYIAQSQFYKFIKSVKPKTIEYKYVVSLLSTQH